MRIDEIIAEEIGDTWEQRHAATQRQQTKRAKASAKLATAQTRAYQQHRRAADQQASTNDKLRDAKRALADASKP